MTCHRGSSGKPVPADLQQLGIIRVDILQNQVRYVWMGGMDHTELEVDRLADGTFRFIGHYNDYKSEVIWPKDLTGRRSEPRSAYMHSVPLASSSSSPSGE